MASIIIGGWLVAKIVGEKKAWSPWGRWLIIKKEKEDEDTLIKEKRETILTL